MISFLLTPGMNYHYNIDTINNDDTVVDYNNVIQLITS